jgi:hypothetical protein
MYCWGSDYADSNIFARLYSGLRRLPHGACNPGISIPTSSPRREMLRVSATKILWGQVITVFLIVLLTIWSATEWGSRLRRAETDGKETGRFQSLIDDSKA